MSLEHSAGSKHRLLHICPGTAVGTPNCLYSGRTKYVSRTAVVTMVLMRVLGWIWLLKNMKQRVSCREDGWELLRAEGHEQTAQAKQAPHEAMHCLMVISGNYHTGLLTHSVSLP